MASTLRRAAAIVAALVVLGSMTAGMRSAGAQEVATTHPAHIHQGTCAALGDVAYPLRDVGPLAPEAGTAATGSAAPGASMAIPVDTSVTTVDVKLADLLAAPYAINVHESAQKIEDYIACGDIGGKVVGGDLMIGLGLVGTPGYAGVALLHAAGVQTTVTIYLAEGRVAAPAPPTEAATPAAVGGVVTVTETEMKITASQTTFKVGRPYTFAVTNVGTTEHELVIEKRADVDQPLQQGDQQAEASNIAPGQTKTLTWTFTEPGAYKVACHLPGHYQAGMVLPIEVTA